MPFNGSGVYTPPAGATTAAPGDVIKSSVWDSIFTDISNALTLLGQQLYGATQVSSTPYVPLAADSFLLMNVASAAVVNLPLSSSRSGYPLKIKDISGAVSTPHVITINANGADTIEGAASITITADYGGWNLYPITGGWVLSP